MGRPRKTGNIEIISTEEKEKFSTEQKGNIKASCDVEILVNKEKSVEEYTKKKKSYSETEPTISCSNEEAHEIIKKIFVGKTLRERWEIVLTAIGRKIGSRPIYDESQILISFIPYCSDNLHLMFIGDKGTGKSGMYQALTDESYIISEQPTASDLRGNKNSSSKDGKAIFDKKIAVFEEFLDYSCSETISIIKNYEETGKYLKYGTDEVRSGCNIVKIGNNKHKITCFENLTAKNILKGITNEWTTEPVLDRQAALMYYTDIFPLTRNDFVENGQKGINTNILLKHLEYMKTLEREIDIPLPEGLSLRKHNIIIKVVKGLINILYPDIIPEDYIIKGLVDIALHFNYILENKHYNPFKISNMKFWLELIKLDSVDVTEGYLLENRVLLRVKDKFWKIPLTPFGTLENEREILFFKENENKTLPIATIHSGSSQMKVIQDYYPLYSKDNHFDENGVPITFNYEKAKFTQKHDSMLLKRILEAGRNEDNIPKEKFEGTTLCSDEKIKNKIKKLLNLKSSAYISSSCFSYSDENGAILINFANLIEDK